LDYVVQGVLYPLEHDPMFFAEGPLAQQYRLVVLLNLAKLDFGSYSTQISSVNLDAARLGQARTHRHAQTRIKSPGNFEEPKIDGYLQGTGVSAFPDTGAAANFVSLQYAQQHGLTIDETLGNRVQVGDGSTIRVVGTTKLPFSFAGETTKHDLIFYVLRKSVHDVILGSAFLRASETFTRFAHRVGRKIRKSIGRGIHRLCFLGSQQYVNGAVNGVGVDAVPDTGADVSVMSAKFAKGNGFKIDDDEQHRIMLGFADGSTARARGVVKDVEWRFGGGEQPHLTDVYVLSNLPVDMVLGYDFLCQTEAFLEHEQDFWCVEDLQREDAWMLCVIRVLGRAMKDAGGGLSCEYHCGAMTVRRAQI
jgi:predicted aspartyl protease